MKNKATPFYLSIIVLIIWIVYSWIKGPTQASIDAKFKTITLDKIQYIVEFYPGGLLLSGKKGENPPYNKERLENVIFSLNGNRDRQIKKAIASYYEPYMTSVIDTLDEYNLEIQQAVIDQMQLIIPKDTAFDGETYKIEKDIWPIKKIVFGYNSNSKYVELSLNVFQDINRGFDGVAPQDYDKFTEVTKRVNKLFQGELKAKILLSDIDKKMPLIYEIIDEQGNTLIKDEDALDRLESNLYEDTEFKIWYQRDGFITTSSFILLFMTFAFFKKNK